MTPKLTAEQRAALNERGAPVAVEDAETHRVYFLIDPDMLESLQDDADLEALKQGIADADAGRTLPLEEVMQRIEANLRSRYSA